MFKKILAMTLCLLMLGAFVACNDAAPSVPTVPEETTKGGSLGVTANPAQTTTTSSTSGGGEQIWVKVATYNIQHGKDETTGRTNLDNMVNLIKDENIDICGFNEIERNAKRSGGVDQPKYIAEKLTEVTGQQYYYAFAASGVGVVPAYDTSYEPTGGKSEAGNAIVSKYPIVGTPRKVEITLPEADQPSDIYEPRVLLIVQIEIKGKLLTVISTHFGLSTKEQEKAVDVLSGELTSLRQNPVVLMGDFNCTPTKNPITRLKEKLKNTSPGNKVTCPKNGNEIDYIFVSKTMQFKDFQVLQKPYSDHLPVVLQVRLQ